MTLYTHEERSLILDDGTTLVWPFINLDKRVGPAELYLDNNVFVAPKWYNLLPYVIKNQATVNLSQAVEEQWVSNPAFSESRLEEFIKPFKEQGVYIEDDYAHKQLIELSENDVSIRSSWMTSYLYVILLYRIFKAKKNDKKPKELLETLKTKEVPRFGSLVSLCTIACYLKENQNINMLDDKKKAYSYLQDFVSAKPSTKKEGECDVSYLRNRAGDCCLWLLPLKLGAKANILKRKQSKIKIDDSFTNIVILTKDKALHRFILRCFPFTYDLKTEVLEGHFDKRNFESNHAENIDQLINKNTRWEQFEKAEPTTKKSEQFANQKRLFDHVTDGADAFLIEEAKKVWDKWLTPRFD